MFEKVSAWCLEAEKVKKSHDLWLESNTWGQNACFSCQRPWVQFPALKTSCLNKRPQTQWLKTTHIYYLTVPEVRSPPRTETKALQFCIPSWRLPEENQHPYFVQLLETTWNLLPLLFSHTQSDGGWLACGTFLTLCHPTPIVLRFLTSWVMEGTLI